MLTFILAILAALIGGVAGGFAIALGFIFIATALGVSDMNGGLSMGAFTTIGPLGGIVCAALCGWLVIRARRGRKPGNRKRELTVAVAILAVLAVLGGGAYYQYVYLPTGPIFGHRAPKPLVRFEVEAPASAIRAYGQASPRMDVRTWNDYYVRTDADFEREDTGDMALLRTRTSLLFKVKDRVAVVWLEPNLGYEFDLPIAKVPDATDDYSGWIAAARIRDREENTVTAAPADLGIRLRYKVEWPNGR
ncbi:MAG: hypothetical protein KDJ77_02405 [Rhodobiaceae bacterium]|nr:hypothetical protein [Rhodobiaceae bacterium]